MEIKRKSEKWILITNLFPWIKCDFEGRNFKNTFFSHQSERISFVRWKSERIDVTMEGVNITDGVDYFSLKCAFCQKNISTKSYYVKWIAVKKNFLIINDCLINKAANWQCLKKTVIEKSCKI